MRNRKRRGRRLQMPEVSLTPLIDTALTLLVIFMITAPMVQYGIKVDLPQGKSKEVATQQELVVSIHRNGTMYFNSYPVKKEELASVIAKAIVHQKDTPVYIRADRAISYGDVIAIVDELKNSGVKYVAMSTRNSTP